MSDQKQNIILVQSINPLEFSFSKQSSSKVIISTPVTTSSKPRRPTSIHNHRLNSLRKPLFHHYEKVSKPLPSRKRNVGGDFIEDPETKMAMRSSLSKQRLNVHQKEIDKLNSLLSKITNQLQKTSVFLSKYKM